MFVVALGYAALQVFLSELVLSTEQGATKVAQSAICIEKNDAHISGLVDEVAGTKSAARISRSLADNKGGNVTISQPDKGIVKMA